MKKIFFVISLLLFTSCNSQKGEKKKAIKDEVLVTKQVDKNVKKITHIDFRQNPAEDYFFTRKYRLTDSELFFYSKSDFKKMNKDKYIVAKRIKDSLPYQLINKKYIGHTTVEIDVPDWTIEIYYNTKDTVYLASGGLPNDMKNYSNLVWEVVTQLDNDQHD